MKEHEGRHAEQAHRRAATRTCAARGAAGRGAVRDDGRCCAAASLVSLANASPSRSAGDADERGTPAARPITTSASASALAGSWLTTTRVSRFASAPISGLRIVRAAGSRFASGSSSSSSSGSWSKSSADRGALHEPARERPQRLVAAAPRADAREQLLDPLRRDRRGGVACKPQVLPRGQLRVEHRLVREEADRPRTPQAVVRQA